MDTSNSITPLSFVLGEQKICQSILTQSDWETILKTAFEALEPRLKYLNGFMELRGFTNFEIGEYRRYNTQMSGSIVSIDSGAGPVFLPNATRALGICVPPLGVHEMNPDSNYVYVHNLVVTKLGDLFIIHAEYCELSGPLYLGEPRIFEATKITVRNVTWNQLDLTQSVSKNSRLDIRLGGKILDNLYRLIEKTISEKEDWVQELREASKEIQSMRYRIDNLFSPPHMILP